MKRFASFFLNAAVAICVCCFLSSCHHGQESERPAFNDTLVILHTDDVHSQVEPYSNNLGGALRRMGFVEDVRKKYVNVLMFDAGDFSQGSSYYKVFKGRCDVELMNKMGYAAATLGNHEFDSGAKYLADTLLAAAKFPVVLSNYQFDEGFVLNERNIKPYLILDTCGLRIGVFGLLVDLQGLTACSELFETPGMHYQSAYDVASRVSTELKEKHHCDYVICLSHLGYKPNEAHPKDVDGEIAQLPNVDLVIGGHDHASRANNRSADGTYYVMNKNQGVEIGMFKLPFERKSKVFGKR